MLLFSFFFFCCCSTILLSDLNLQHMCLVQGGRWKSWLLTLNFTSSLVSMPLESLMSEKYKSCFVLKILHLLSKYFIQNSEKRSGILENSWKSALSTWPCFKHGLSYAYWNHFYLEITLGIFWRATILSRFVSAVTEIFPQQSI